jgi:two-component system response regulator HydG
MPVNEPGPGRYWEKFINSVNEGLLFVGPDGKIVMVNAAFERMLGYKNGEVIGRPCTILNCDACETVLDDGEPWWCVLFESDRSLKQKCLVTKKDGSYLPVLKSASLMKDERGKTVGAIETITDISEIERMDREIAQLSSRVGSGKGFQGLIGQSEAIQKVFQVVEKAAQSESPVMIFGESGTGKELVAGAIHKLGRRREGPFMAVNCAALNEGLLESELFGHVKGAFTGAHRHRRGRFEAAHGGDILLDEVGDMPLSMQVKLLRVLETKRIERVGEQRSIPVDVRIITATNKDLEELIARDRFRKDLYYRINVIPIHLPPLRERLEDIPLLVPAFLRRLRSATKKRITGLSPETMERFMDYHWPGNIRELKSALEYAFVVGEEGLIRPAQLPAKISEGKKASGSGPFFTGYGDAAERSALIDALRQTRGNQSQAARILGISRGTVWNRMKRFGINLKKVLDS